MIKQWLQTEMQRKRSDILFPVMTHGSMVNQKTQGTGFQHMVNFVMDHCPKPSEVNSMVVSQHSHSLGPLVPVKHRTDLQLATFSCFQP